MLAVGKLELGTGLQNSPVSFRSGRAEQKFPLTSNPDSMNSSAFQNQQLYIQSQALLSILCTLLYISLTLTVTAPVWLSYSLANKPPAMLFTQFFPLLQSVA